MSGVAVVSANTRQQLVVVAEFFGIDLESNLHIFRHPAQIDPQAFAVVVKALAEAVEQDGRRGINARIRASIANGKHKK